MQASIQFEKAMSENTEVLQYHTANVVEFVTGASIQLVIKTTKEKEITFEKIRMVAGEASKLAQKYPLETISINENDLQKNFPGLQGNEVMTAFIEGWLLGAYAFNTNASQSKKPIVELAFQQPALHRKAMLTGEIRAEATAFSRDLMNETPGALTPESFSTYVQQAFKNTSVKIKTHNQAALEEMQMNGMLAVSRGSKYQPHLIELHYEADPEKPLIVLVGKGVTFDAGGISLKGGRNISNVRMDMGGAAAVAGAVKLLAASELPVNVVGVIPAVENMPGKDAMLPGEVIHYKNGHHVQIGNTDAEGRLILADGILRAEELEAAYTIDIATLTGSAVRALGTKYAGIFGEETLVKVMKQLGDNNGDFAWPMPLVEEYDQTLQSDYADFCNISTMGEAGAITAALFLRRFVSDERKWVHIDMAGTMEKPEQGYYTKQASGYGARLLADFVQEISK